MPQRRVFEREHTSKTLDFIECEEDGSVKSSIGWLALHFGEYERKHDGNEPGGKGVTRLLAQSMGARDSPIRKVRSQQPNLPALICGTRGAAAIALFSEP
jgi:hypothetical protein